MNDELDDMKNIWQNAPTQPRLDAQQIQALIATRSKSALTQLRTNLLIEFGFGVFLTALLLFAASHAKTEQASWALVQLTFLMAPFFLFYYYALKNLSTGISMQLPLRQMLEGTIQFWQTSLKIYFWGGVLLLPAVFIAARWWRLQMMGNGEIQFFTGSTGVVVFKAAIAWFLTSALVWGLIKVSYWKHVEKLKKCLAEIEAAE